ncbi:MAG: hypothetical protein IKV17_07680 [Bacteroidaceae bacterium]|nr:hypothetical protein [Bacteroidaceae bacterium]
MLIDKEEPKNKSRDLLFGSLLILDSVKKIGNTLGWLSAKPKIVVPEESENSFPPSPFRFHIEYMTEEEVMKYLISTKQ